jgi:uncharacterized DUF497 family protein
MDYGEDRFTATGLVDGQILMVVYVERAERIRTDIGEKGDQA